MRGFLFAPLSCRTLPTADRQNPAMRGNEINTTTRRRDKRVLRAAARLLRSLDSAIEAVGAAKRARDEYRRIMRSKPS